MVPEIDCNQVQRRTFGQSGAKLIWGGEAVAVSADGRANPRQLWLHEARLPDVARLREKLVDEQRERFGSTHDLVVGLQLTHSGRFGALKTTVGWSLEFPTIIRFWTKKFETSADSVLSDTAVERLIEDFVRAAALARRAGFHFVDINWPTQVC
jgi:2,4-dienoyl-CoA reductase-like NADH-dependent reductase (Old Yellow Enzyme family)